MKILLASLIVFLLNIPFGYWRGNVKKFSFQWILSIHVPVPAVVAIRFLSGIGFAFITYPVLIGAFFTGQFVGTAVLGWRQRENKFPVTSCLPCDLLNAALINYHKD